MKCGNPNLTVNDPSKCAEQTSAMVFSNGVSVLDVVANMPDSSGKYELKCAPYLSVSESFSSKCSDDTSPDSSQRKGEATCSIAPTKSAGGQKTQLINQYSPSNSATFAHPEADSLFDGLHDIMHDQGYELLPFEGFVP